MIWALRILFIVLFLLQGYWVTWASLQESLLEIPLGVQQDPWWITTLWDIWLSFTPFYLWSAYRSDSWLERIVWFLVIYGLGTVGIAGYLLVVLFRLPSDASVKEILLAPRDKPVGGQA